MNSVETATKRTTCTLCGKRRLCIHFDNVSTCTSGWKCSNGCEQEQASITFSNNTDYERGLTFTSKADFLAFANSYISNPATWGNRYSQDIDGIDIRWSPRAQKGAGGWVEQRWDYSSVEACGRSF